MTMTTRNGSLHVPLVKLKASPQSPKCPFINHVEITLSRGGCVWLTGRSGAGKTSLSNLLAGLSGSATAAKRLDINVDVEWNPSIPKSQQCGMLFQQTTLVDELTVAGNLAIAIQQAHAAANPNNHKNGTNGHGFKTIDQQIKYLLEAVGLDYRRDANKRPTQLSGGMGRRVSLALQLAQKKHVVILDEPFTGLDEQSAMSVARELVRLRQSHGTALLLISHEPHLAQLVMHGFNTNGDSKDISKTSSIVHLETILDMSIDHHNHNGNDSSRGHPIRPNLYGTTLLQRFMERILDYVLWSLPLILLTFLACGLAISMLSCDILRRIDVKDQVLEIVEREVKPLLKMVMGGEEDNIFALMMVKMKVKGMMDEALPQAKALLYSMGMAKLFVLEVGPLLTALLLCGRIGGSYAGKIATMEATCQNKLLATLGINSQAWTLMPSFTAALLASPLLSVLGTSFALYLGAMVGPQFGIGTLEGYWEQVWECTFPILRIKSFEPLWQDGTSIPMVLLNALLFQPDWTTTTKARSNHSALWWLDTMVEISTHPVMYHLLKAWAFISIIMLTAEACARARTNNLTPRDVPSVITSAVVMASLLIIVADWGFSQLLLQRK